MKFPKLSLLFLAFALLALVPELQGSLIVPSGGSITLTGASANCLGTNSSGVVVVGSNCNPSPLPSLPLSLANGGSGGSSCTGAGQVAFACLSSIATNLQNGSININGAYQTSDNGSPTLGALEFTTTTGDTWITSATTTGIPFIFNNNGSTSVSDLADFYYGGSKVAGFSTAGGLTATNITDSALTSGQCVQTATGGLFAVTGSACNSGSYLTGIVAGNNIVISGGAPTPTVAETNSPTWTGTATDSNATAFNMSGTGANTIASATTSGTAFVFNNTGSTSGDLIDFNFGGTNEANFQPNGELVIAGANNPAIYFSNSGTNTITSGSTSGVAFNFNDNDSSFGGTLAQFGFNGSAKTAILNGGNVEITGTGGSASAGALAFVNSSQVFITSSTTNNAGLTFNLSAPGTDLYTWENNGSSRSVLGATGFLQIAPTINSTNTLAPLGPVYTHTGTAAANTFHGIQDSCTFSSSTTCAVTITSSAATFSSQTSYSCSATGNSTSGVVTVENSSASAFTLTAASSNSQTIPYTCWGT